MRKNIMEFASNAHTKNPPAKEAQDEAMFVGAQPRPTTPVVLTPAESGRLRALIISDEIPVLTPRMQEAITNYKRIMGENVD